MDEDFIRSRAEQIRELATKADASTKKRLLALADTYERRLHPAPHAASGLAGRRSPPQAKP